MIYTYREVITGFAARITQSELKTMESMDGFLLARKDGELEIRTTYTPKLLGLERNGGMWYESFYGHDKIIAVIDTGVKPTHPSFSGQGMAPAPKKWNGTCYWTAYEKAEKTSRADRTLRPPKLPRQPKPPSSPRSHPVKLLKPNNNKESAKTARSRGQPVILLTAAEQRNKPPIRRDREVARTEKKLEIKLMLVTANAAR
ncbi:hypothetical protein KSP39_PZI012439 [Platanthera zijinensis]|uniref:Uncharacterized protein n=1 Tax=Platanthera zijinensis TaxID=2320716 RepID=A0AAP0BFW1_9ASPA